MEIGDILIGFSKKNQIMFSRTTAVELKFHFLTVEIIFLIQVFVYPQRVIPFIFN